MKKIFLTRKKIFLVVFEKNGLPRVRIPLGAEFFCTKKSIFVQKNSAPSGIRTRDQKKFLGGQGKFLKFFQKHIYSKQGGYLREKNIFDTKKNIFGRF